jgi:diguanylate cyclase (GGDEF)-like protein
MPGAGAVHTEVLDVGDARAARGPEPGRPDDGAGGGAVALVATARISHAYVALVAGLAGLALLDRGAASGPNDLLVGAGMVSLVALVAGSVRLRNEPVRPWNVSQHDPFVAFAASLAALILPAVLLRTPLGDTGSLVERNAWATALVAAACAGIGFLTMIRDMRPGRVLDALYLSGIGALAMGLIAWLAAVRLAPHTTIGVQDVAERLLPAGFDLFVVGLGLQALHLRSRAREGVWMLLAAWTLVFAVHASELLAWVMDSGTSQAAVVFTWMIAFGLLGAAALHPDMTQAAEPVFGPLDRLPHSQVALLGGAVLLGPAAVLIGVGEGGAATLLTGLAAALSLLVVIYLVRLVQGRAVFEHRAHHDELTGLANRTLFEDRAAVAIAHARRTNRHSAVLFLDLDRFKNVNDSLGHAVGNLLLQAVAKRLRGATRAEDTVARLGGDEFVVFVPELDDAEQAADIAAKILEQFAEPFALNGNRLFASPSIGIAVFPEDGEDADGLLKNADTAMYRAKQRGRRTFCTYDRSMNDHAHERLALESRLHSAIEHHELRLHYQPKIHLPTGRVMGMEALLRWEHPDLGLLEPSEFIPVAEASGLIVPLGEWALEEACRQNQRWSQAGFQPLVVAVNLSLRQFQQQRIEDVIARVLRSSGLDPELLELEVTESLAMHDPAQVRSTLLDLREMGVKCSIDDFGTGYSGLSHLTRFPVDKLKIDKSFVATIDTDREAPIVVAVVALAHGLGLEAVAEGVETPQQLERLQELGCDEMQGYLFSRPVPADRFEQLLMLESIAPGPGRLDAADGRLRLVTATG